MSSVVFYQVLIKSEDLYFLANLIYNFSSYLKTSKADIFSSGKTCQYIQRHDCGKGITQRSQMNLVSQLCCKYGKLINEL